MALLDRHPAAVAEAASAARLRPADRPPGRAGEAARDRPARPGARAERRGQQFGRRHRAAAAAGARHRDGRARAPGHGVVARRRARRHPLRRPRRQEAPGERAGGQHRALGRGGGGQRVLDLLRDAAAHAPPAGRRDGDGRAGRRLPDRRLLSRQGARHDLRLHRRRRGRRRGPRHRRVLPRLRRLRLEGGVHPARRAEHRSRLGAVDKAAGACPRRAEQAGARGDRVRDGRRNRRGGRRVARRRGRAHRRRGAGRGQEAGRAARRGQRRGRRPCVDVSLAGRALRAPRPHQRVRHRRLFTRLPVPRRDPHVRGAVRPRALRRRAGDGDTDPRARRRGVGPRVC